jgi:hypothetical protein
MDELEDIISQLQLINQELKDDNDKFEHKEKALKELNKQENINDSL